MYPPSQQQNVPRYDTLMYQVISFAPNQPPWVPSIACPPNIQALLPGIAAACANSVNAGMSLSPLGVFHFNQVAANNYQNNDFATLVSTAVDMLQYGLMKGMYRFPEEGAADAVEKARKMLSAYNVYTFQHLRSVIDPRLLNDVDQIVQQASQVQNEIRNMKQGGMQPQMQPQMQQQWGGVQQAPYSAQMPMQNAPSPYGNGFNGGRPQMPPRPGVNNTPFATGNMQTAFVQQQMPDAGIPDETDRYSYLRKNNQSVQQTDPYLNQGGPGRIVKVTTFDPEVVERQRTHPLASVAIDPIAGDINPPGLQPYPYANNSKAMSFVLKQDGSNIEARIKEGDEMDRAQHTLTFVEDAYTKRIPEGFQSRENAFSDSVYNMVKEQKVYADAELENTLGTGLYADSVWLEDMFLDCAVFNVRRHQAIALKGQTNCKSYQRYVVMGNPIICTQKLAEVLSTIVSKATRLSDMANMLKEIVKHPDTSAEEYQTLLQIDDYLTKEINSVLKNKLNVDVNIDSFIDDVGGLAPFIHNQNGQIYSEALIMHQKDFIQACFSFMDENDTKAVIDANFPTEGEQLNDILVFNSNYSITVVNVLSKELNVIFTEGEVNAIKQSALPTMYRMIKEGIESAEKENVHFLHHILVTADNKRYEMHRGWIGNEFFLLSKM